VKEAKILIVAGGTGGHITPGIALYEEFRRKNIPVLFLSGKKDVRFSLLNMVAAGDLLLYHAPKLTRNPLKMPVFLVRILIAYLAAQIGRGFALRPGYRVAAYRIPTQHCQPP
jgi:UDP-N-acetylglucosamine:LPS N-acetylglucosamine transferase